MNAISIAKRGALVSAVVFCFVVLATASTGLAQSTTPPGDKKADNKTGDNKTPPATTPAPDPKSTPTTDPKANPKPGTQPGTAPATPGAGTPTGTPGAGPPTGTPGAGTPTGTPGAGTPTGTPDAANGGTTDTANVPINLRLRRLEQRVQALKERAWRAKARVGMLKEAVLGGGIGARATIVHKNKMGGSFRLIKLIYALDGTQIFARTSDSGSLPKSLDVLTGPIAPGSHTISVFAIYRGHGYGVFKYLNKYRFRVRSSHTFTASEGKDTHIEVVGFERGGSTTPLEKRPAVDFKVTTSRGGGK